MSIDNAFVLIERHPTVYTEELKHLLRVVHPPNGGAARCVFCGQKVSNESGPNKVNIDHAVARSKGGNNTLENANVTCAFCNQSKGTGMVPKSPKSNMPSPTNPENPNPPNP